jgi:hypothetical protein
LNTALKLQHRAAIRLLKQLGVDNIRLERQTDGRYRFIAWNLPLRDGNGSMKKPKRGIVRV